MQEHLGGPRTRGTKGFKRWKYGGGAKTCDIMPPQCTGEFQTFKNGIIFLGIKKCNMNHFLSQSS